MCYLDYTGAVGTDMKADGTTEGFDFWATTHLMLIPTGNHVNTYRRPALVPAIHGIRLDRTLYSSDVDPNVYYYKDDLWTDPILLGTSEEPARRAQSIGYRTHEWFPNDSAYRIALKFEVLTSTKPVKFHSFAVQWNPEGGA
jgi:hypothetical protein